MLSCLMFLFAITSVFAQDNCSNSERALVNIRPHGLTEITALKLIQGEMEIAFLGDSTKNILVSVFPPMVKERHYYDKVSFERNTQILNSKWKITKAQFNYDGVSVVNSLAIFVWIICFLIGMILFLLNPDFRYNLKKHFIGGAIISVILGGGITLLYSASLDKGPRGTVLLQYVINIALMYLGFIVRFSWKEAIKTIWLGIKKVQPDLA